MRVAPYMEVFPLHFTLFFALARLRRAIFPFFFLFLALARLRRAISPCFFALARLRRAQFPLHCPSCQNDLGGTILGPPGWGPPPEKFFYRIFLMKWGAPP